MIALVLTEVQTMARPQTGLGHIDGLNCSAEVKRRLRAVLSVLQGTYSVAEACEELGVSPARFHSLRKQALEGASGALEPRPPGRPRAVHDEPREVDRLRSERRDLRRRLYAAEIREEIALTMPHLLHRRSGKKTGRRSGE